VSSSVTTDRNVLIDNDPSSRDYRDRQLARDLHSPCRQWTMILPDGVGWLPLADSDLSARRPTLLQADLLASSALFCSPLSPQSLLS
jgi:hypothetical protein